MAGKRREAYGSNRSDDVAACVAGGYDAASTIPVHGYRMIAPSKPSVPVEVNALFHRLLKSGKPKSKFSNGRGGV